MAAQGFSLSDFARRDRASIWFSLYGSVQFALLLGYLAFIPLGPYPIPVMGTKLDVLFAVFLLLTLLPVFPMAFTVHSLAVTFSLFAYLGVAFLSVATSDAPLASLRDWLVTLGYAAIAYIGSAVFASRSRAIRSWLLAFATITALAVFWLVATVETEARFAFGPDFGIPIQEGIRYVDPNHTGIGLMLALVVAIPLLQAPRSYRGTLRWLLTALCAGVIAIAGVITLSRTALVASVGGVFLALLTLVVIGTIWLRFRSYLWTSGAAALAGITILLSVVPFIWPFITMVLDRLVHAGEDTARFDLVAEAFAAYGQNLKTLAFGQGFMLLNPHNEYLRNLASSGVLALGAFLAFLAVVFKYSSSPPSGIYMRDIGRYALFFFISISMLFYPLVKLFWVAILFLLMFGLHERHGLSLSGEKPRQRL